VETATVTRAAIVMVLLASAGAHARDAEGRLGLVRAPNSTQPAIVISGGTLDVALSAEASLRLESASGTYALPPPNPHPSRGLVAAATHVSAEVAPGLYTLVAEAGGVVDRSFRSVLVLPAPMESYRVAVWSNVRIGANPGAPDTALFRIAAEINAGAPALVLVTGDLTAEGTADQFRLAIALLNECAAPTFVVPGARDLASGRAGEFLGMFPTAVPFGFDAFLLTPPAAATTPWTP
jgi:hypothetical protein